MGLLLFRNKSLDILLYVQKKYGNVSDNFIFQEECRDFAKSIFLNIYHRFKKISVIINNFRTVRICPVNDLYISAAPDC